ncbi:hypothetical protein [Hungatella hathewayi]|uniref:hypothetical protein n=1 Tax=Hungatella hathewayi TaxID=154046 RepID=UPI0026DB5BD6|nr:hypothetical protein [Hungatella hathewayi]
MRIIIAEDGLKSKLRFPGEPEEGIEMENAVGSVSTIRNFMGNAGRNTCNESLYKALQDADEALQKQIPMKPQEVLLACGKGYECSNCGNELSVSAFDGAYCHWCGQRLDW